MNKSILAHLDISDDNILWHTKVDVSFFLESIKVCLLFQSLPRCNQNQTSVQKKSLKKLFNNQDSISKFELRQFFEKMIYTLFLTKICPAEDIDEVCEIMTESVTGVTNLIFDQIQLDKDGKLKLEDVFEEFKVGDLLCHLAPRFINFVTFQDQPSGYLYGHQHDSEESNDHQYDSEESNERPGKELSFLYLLSLNRPCTTVFTAFSSSHPPN